MNLSPDAVIFRQWHFVTLNATIIYTWAVMFVMAFGSWLITRKLSSGPQMTRWQNLLEVLVEGIQKQIRGVTHQKPRVYVPFAGTIFLFIAVSNVLSIVPVYEPPTGSLSTTTALALCVFVAIPTFGIAQRGLREYLGHYTRPSVFMLPFNIMGEISRTIALAVRLFGNVMSGTMIAAILISITPFLFPIVMQALGLLTGLIQAYIFAVLAMVYIASASRAFQEREIKQQEKKGEPHHG